MIARPFSRSSAGWLFASSSLLLTGGCATVVAGISGHDETRFSSQPEGAEVTLIDGTVCTTPCVLHVDPVVDQKVTATLAGHSDQSQQLERRIAYPFWGNALLGVAGLVAAVVDWYDGFIWTYGEPTLHFDFTSDKPVEPAVVVPRSVPEEPDTPALRALKERFPEAYLIEQIRNYYGEKSAEDRQLIMRRLYRLMLEMEAAGDRVDIDEAVRRDYR